MEKGQRYGDSLAADSEREVRSLLEASGLRGRVVGVNVDASTGLVVTSVRWEDVDAAGSGSDANLVASLVWQGAPVTWAFIFRVTERGSGRELWRSAVHRGGRLDKSPPGDWNVTIGPQVTATGKSLDPKKPGTSGTSAAATPDGG